MVKRILNGPVYVVKPEKRNGPHRTLHRDLLLPCGFLPASPEKQMPGTNLTVNRKRKMRTRANTEVQESDECEEQSSDEERGYFQIPIPEIVTKSPFIKQVDDGLPTSHDVPAKSSDQLNPHAVEFAPRTSTMPRSEPVMEPTREASEIFTGGAPVFPATESIGIENAPDYIAIEIPEEIVPAAGSESQELSHSSVDAESVPLRRSGRERRPPKTLEYEELGKPILLALTSFFDSLGNILAASLVVNTHAGTHAV